MHSLSCLSFDAISSLVALSFRPRVAFLIMLVSRLLNRRWAFLVGIREVLGRASSSGVGGSFCHLDINCSSSSDEGEGSLARRARGGGGRASSSGVGGFFCHLNINCSSSSDEGEGSLARRASGGGGGASSSDEDEVCASARFHTLSLPRSGGLSMLVGC